jgi:hypothetical protein
VKEKEKQFGRGVHARRPAKENLNLKKAMTEQ